MIALGRGLRRFRPMAPEGLRGRIVVSVGAVVLVTMAVAFATVYHETSTQLRSQLDASIRVDAKQFATAATAHRGASAQQVLAAARSYARSQPYQLAAVLLFAIVPGYGTASNHEELVSASPLQPGETPAQQAREDAETRRLATPHPGYSTGVGVDVGPLRVFQQAVNLAGGLRLYAAAAEPLQSIQRAQHEVLRSFVLAGTLALLLALGFAYLTGSRMSAPLRTAARVAAEVDGGELSPRMRLPAGTNRELLVLADSFNHMLDRLTAAFEAQTAFVADASHELKTPLTVIRGQLEVLASRREVDRAEVVRVERLVQAEISRLSRLTGDLLLLARSDNADFLRRRPVVLAPFVHELWNGLSLTAQRRFQVGPLVDVTVSADPDRLAQALRNLGTNAVAHTAEPDGLVAISMRMAEADRARVRITVADDGPGIAPEQRQPVFERFYRTDAGRARTHGGAGLGLAIVKAIVEAHGGTITVADSTAGGAAFEIELPVGANAPESAT